jgi:stress response protein SCP2
MPFAVELEVHFAWRPDGPVCYLDGACLIFGRDRSFREMVCWCHQVSQTTQHLGAVVHSGHVLNWDEHRGENRLSIDLGQLGPEVEEVVVTLSSYDEAQLSHIIHPFVQLRETVTGMELCQCHLDSISILERQLWQCMILSRIYRKNGEGAKQRKGGWGVQSVMDFCQGHTGCQRGMVEAVTKL